jgi:hypothetical protein
VPIKGYIMWFDYREYMDIIIALLVIAGIYSGQNGK